MHVGQDQRRGQVDERGFGAPAGNRIDARHGVVARRRLHVGLDVVDEQASASTVPGWTTPSAARGLGERRGDAVLEAARQVVDVKPVPEPREPAATWRL